MERVRESAAGAAERAAGGLSARPAQVYRLRRCAGGGKELGRAHQGGAAGAALSGDPAAAGAADLSGAGKQPHPLSARAARWPNTRPTARRSGGSSFPSGSTLEFGYCACDGDMDRYQGAEYDVIFHGRGAPSCREEWMRQFAACLRGRQRLSQADLLHLQPRRAGTRLHQAAVSSTGASRPARTREDYVFIPAKVTDNKALLRGAAGLSAPAGGAAAGGCATAWLRGKVGSLRGAGFSGVRRTTRRTTATGASRMSSHRLTSRGSGRSCRSYDFGYAKPFSCGVVGGGLTTGVSTGFWSCTACTSDTERGRALDAGQAV